MSTALNDKIPTYPGFPKVDPACQVFGECGGCVYQHLEYSDELLVKQKQIKDLLINELNLDKSKIEPIIASPKPYNYRNRLDLSLLKSKKRNEVKIGFKAEGRFTNLDIETCAIAQESIADFIPQLKKEAIEKLPADYRIATLTIKTGDDARVFWGGIGTGSLRQKEEDYLWTEIDRKRVFYSLDTFFQANSSILLDLKRKIESWANFDRTQTCFLDLYSGVGLFGILFAKKVRYVYMIEDSKNSLKVAHHNVKYHNLKNTKIIEGKVEEKLPEVLTETAGKPRVAIIDPPRKGLHPQAAEFLSNAKELDSLLYLSCSPESLIRDLKIFLSKGWKIEKACALDFFPKTKHIETLVLLKP